MAGTGNWGWVFAQLVTAGTGVNGLRAVMFIAGQTKNGKQWRCLFQSEDGYVLAD